MPDIIPHLWFERGAVEAAKFYVSLFEDSRIDRIGTVPADTPSGPAGSVETVAFTLRGRPMMAIAAGPLDPFNHAISLVADCADQAEIDRLWAALSDGGAEERCGWLRDRFGVSWQIVPVEFADMLNHEDRAKAGRAMNAMLGMVKVDIAALRRAFEGT